MRRWLPTLLITVAFAAPALAQRGSTPPAPPPPAPARPAPPRPPAPPPSVEAVAVRPEPPEPPLGMVGLDGHSPRSWRTVKLDIVITDSVSGKKTMSLVLVDGKRGSIRSNTGPRMLNADAVASLPDTRLLQAIAAGRAAADPRAGIDGKVLLDLTVIYQPQADNHGPSTLNESVSVVVADGVPTVISQSADPANDRRVTLEVTATQIK